MKPLLFDLDPAPAFGEAVASTAGADIGSIEERRFEDSEHKTRPLVAVAGRDVFVLHSLHSDPGQSVNDKLVRLLLFVATMRDAGAARVTALVPYLAYARKDRRTQVDDPVSTRYVASLLESVGTNVVVTMDVHNLAAYQNAFRIRAVHLEATEVFVRHFGRESSAADFVVVSPDAGGIKRADAVRQALAAALGRPIGAAFTEKYRSGGVVRGDALLGEVEGKVAIIVDDLISAGTTVARTAERCHLHGAARIVAAATHGVFAPAAASALAHSPIASVVVTDTVAPVAAVASALGERLVRVSVTGFFGDAVRTLHEELG